MCRCNAFLNSTLEYGKSGHANELMFLVYGICATEMITRRHNNIKIENLALDKRKLDDFDSKRKHVVFSLPTEGCLEKL